jgi:hypothetical protein
MATKKTDQAPEAPAVQPPATEAAVLEPTPAAPPKQPRTVAEIEKSMKELQERHRLAAEARAEEEKVELSALLAERAATEQAQREAQWREEGAVKAQKTRDAIAAIKALKGATAEGDLTAADAAVLADYDKKVEPVIKRLKEARAHQRRCETEHGAQLDFLVSITREDLLYGMPSQGLRGVQSQGLVTAFLQEVERQQAGRDGSTLAMLEGDVARLRSSALRIGKQEFALAVNTLIRDAGRAGAGFSTRRALELLTGINEMKKSVAGQAPPFEYISKSQSATAYDQQRVLPEDMRQSRYDTELKGY